MTANQEYGKSYYYENTFWNEPQKYGNVLLYQAGEIQYEQSYEVPEHLQLCHEILLIIGGEGESIVNGQTYYLKQGDLFITRKGEYHRVFVSGSNGMHSFYLGFNLSDDSKSNDNLVKFFNGLGNPRHIESANNLMAPFSSLMDELFYQNENYQDLVTSLLQQIIIFTYRNILNVTSQKLIIEKNSPASGSATIYGIIKYIDKNIENLSSIRKMSSDLGYSYNYFSRFFKEKACITLRDYINNRKIKHSLELIDSNRFSITRIALMLNYNTVQSFNKAFKRVMNISPSEYKRLQQNKAEKSQSKNAI